MGKGMVKGKRGSGMPKKKFQYGGRKFLEKIEELAAKGLTDREIARQLLVAFGDKITPERFSAHKNEKDAEGNLTREACMMREALTRGRDRINAEVRSAYLQLALGNRTVKTVKRQYAQVRCACGGGDGQCAMCGGTGYMPAKEKPITQETVAELPPNAQALATWLFNHDEEWRRMAIEGKRLDITSAGNPIGGVLEIVDEEGLVR
jgi:hypothetical protein